MALFETLLDLFRHGAVSIAEQFIRGTTRIDTFSGHMAHNFGSEYAVPNDIETDFLNTVQSASIPASQLNLGRIPAEGTIPGWPGSDSPGMLIHTGLSKITVLGQDDEKVFSTHIPFSYKFRKLLNLEDAIERIRSTISQGGEKGQDFYQPDIDRIEETIKYLRQTGFKEEVTAEFYSVFNGVEL